MPDSFDARIPSLRHRVSPDEWQARLDLAAAYRLVALYGMSDLSANHISARIPGEEAFLINPYGMLYEEITASSLIKIDHEGNVLLKPEFPGQDYGVNRAGFVIHSAVHKARHEVACVAHTHTWAGMAVSALDCGLLPLTQTSMRFAKIGYHDYAGVVLDVAMQDALLRDLGEHDALVLRNHGLLTAGRTVAEAFNLLHRLELSCRTQIAAMSCGTELRAVPPEVVEATWRNYQPNVRRPFGVMEWPAMLRKLDRVDPSWRD